MVTVGAFSHPSSASSWPLHLISICQTRMAKNRKVATARSWAAYLKCLVLDLKPCVRLPPHIYDQCVDVLEHFRRGK